MIYYMSLLKGLFASISLQSLISFFEASNGNASIVRMQAFKHEEKNLFALTLL